MTGRRLRAARPLAALVTLVAACAPVRSAPRAAPAPAVDDGAFGAVADRLFLGRAIGDTGAVNDEQWGAFVRDVVAPQLREGLTVWRADGQWRDPGGHVVREPVMVVEVVHARDPRVDAALADVAREYRRRFAQDAVLRVTIPVAARLYLPAERRPTRSRPSRCGGSRRVATPAVATSSTVRRGATDSF